MIFILKIRKEHNSMINLGGVIVLNLGGVIVLNLCILSAHALYLYQVSQIHVTWFQSY